MTSPALLVLSFALVCSIGTTSVQTADHDIMPIANNDTFKMETNRTKTNDRLMINNSINDINDKINEFDDIYTGEEEFIRNLDVHRKNLAKFTKSKSRYFAPASYDVRRRVKREEEQDPRCEEFIYTSNRPQISHPHAKNSTSYYSNIDCVTVINATEGQVIELTFVDVFHIESHPECEYDFLEIRDGLNGYAKCLDKVCGEAFPRQITSSGPSLWLKFSSDDTIEYQGFYINIAMKPDSESHSIPESCYIDFNDEKHGIIDTAKIPPECISQSQNQALDVLWTIKTPENTKIYLNFTSYALSRPNECEDNVVQVFGSILEFPKKLAHYCGSMANAVTTKSSDGSKGGKEEKSNIMYVRLYASKSGKGSSFNATFTAYRSLDPTKDEKCDEKTEFNCEDNTCIALELRCDNYAHCRLKADEDTVLCRVETESVISQPHILVILVIFSLILSGMSFVFMFKCIRKLYQDHKIIKEHIQQSCEDRLDSLVGQRLTLDAKRLERDSESQRPSLERENHTNEMFKQQRSFSQRKPSSIDSDFIQETHLDLDEEIWRREVDSVPIETENVRIERNGRTRRSDLSKKEESIRSKSKSDEKDKKEIRDVSVGAPDTKESGCQTRESLFQTETAPSSDGSGSNSRGFSTFGYSGATIARPSPAPATNTSELTIELLRQVPHQESVKSQKKIPDRRPMSTETTRSAPDVIIVSKPIR